MKNLEIRLLPTQTGWVAVDANGLSAEASSDEEALKQLKALQIEVKLRAMMRPHSCEEED